MKESNNKMCETKCVKMCETNNNDICIMSNQNLARNGKMNKETKWKLL